MEVQSHDEQRFDSENQNSVDRNNTDQQSYQAFELPSIIETQVFNEKTQETIICRIEVFRPVQSKPYLGGLKNVKTERDYHHAFAQTDQRVRDHKTKYTRETQTYEYNTVSTKVMREFGTQMERVGISIDTRQDKETQPKMYFTSEMWEERREEASLYIQRMMRGYHGWKRVDGLRKEKKAKEEEQERMEEEFRKNEEIKHKQEIERRMHPRTKEDFDILYEELEVWRLNETEKIKKSTMSEEDRKKALKQLLDKETELLQTIDRLKINAQKLNKQDKIQKFLGSMANPKEWKRSDNRYTEVHTPFTTRAKELMDIYNGLRMTNIPLDERLDILLNTKWTVKEFDCQLTREIVDLIDREADMLSRGRGEGSLEGLRKRLCNLFLQFIEKPEFNPEAARFQKIPFDLLQRAQNVYKE